MTVRRPAALLHHPARFGGCSDHDSACVTAARIRASRPTWAPAPARRPRPPPSPPSSAHRQRRVRWRRRKHALVLLGEQSEQRLLRRRPFGRAHQCRVRAHGPPTVSLTADAQCSGHSVKPARPEVRPPRASVPAARLVADDAAARGAELAARRRRRLSVGRARHVDHAAAQPAPSSGSPSAQPPVAPVSGRASRSHALARSCRRAAAPPSRPPRPSASRASRRGGV